MDFRPQHERSCPSQPQGRSPRHDCSRKLSRFAIRSLPGTWLRDKNLVRSHHLSGQKDSGYKANSIALSPSYVSREGCQPRDLPMFGRENTANSGRIAIPHWIREDVAQGRFAGGFETKKIDFGTWRNGRRERAAGAEPRRNRRSRARSKCAASPCCRTFRNVRNRHIPRESPRRKSAWHRLGNATGAALPHPPGSP